VLWVVWLLMFLSERCEVMIEILLNVMSLMIVSTSVSCVS